MVIFVFPLLSFLLGIIGQIFIKKIYIVVGITLLGWLITAFTIFNESFLIWVVIYTILAFIGSGIIHFSQSSKSS